MTMSGKKVIIMGGSSGIGLETAKVAAAKGAVVTITGRDQDKIQSALKELPGTANGVSVDVTSAIDIHEFFNREGAFDHLVLSLSGKGGGGPFGSLDVSTLRQAFDVKFFGYFTTLQAGLGMIRPGGSVVMITAGSARHPFPGTSGLAAINGALECMVPTLAVELKPLRVNAVSPGVINTPWWGDLPPETREKTFTQLASQTLVGRIGRTEDVAQAVMFLMRNTYMTGAVIACDGGMGL